MGNVKRNDENLFLLLNLYVVPKYSTSTGLSYIGKVGWENGDKGGKCANLEHARVKAAVIS